MPIQLHHCGRLFLGAALLCQTAFVGCVAKSSGLMAPAERPKPQRTLTASQFQSSSSNAESGAADGADASAGHTTSQAPPLVNATPSAKTPDTGSTGATAEELSVETIPAMVSHGGLVGQVNGRPIYVADFFEPIESQLRILGRDKSRREFITEAYPLIQRQLAEFIKNELVYAEAEASLTENERVGLRYFLQQLEGDITRPRGRQAQDARLREEMGLGLDEVIELERRRQLVLFKISSEIRKRVIISWRDIERYYRDHRAEFNPPASIQLRLLAVPADNAALRTEIQQSLADGYLFGTLAEQYSTMLASRGGLMEPILLNTGLESTALTAWPAVDEVARSLAKGEYGGPVVVGDRAIWVYVEDFADGSGRTLYDVQHEIEARLFQERFKEQEQKYLAELFARGNMDDFDNMSILLLDIAMQRWAKPE